MDHTLLQKSRIYSSKIFAEVVTTVLLLSKLWTRSPQKPSKAESLQIAGGIYFTGCFCFFLVTQPTMWKHWRNKFKVNVCHTGDYFEHRHSANTARPCWRVWWVGRSNWRSVLQVSAYHWFSAMLRVTVAYGISRRTLRGIPRHRQRMSRS